MEKRPPACPRQAWMEDSSSQESRSPGLQLPSSCEVTTMQPLKLDASWLPIYKEEQEAVDSILAFVTSPNKEERDKATFLQSISVLCRSALNHGLTQGLDLFCDTYQLAENIKALLEEEPRDQLCTDLRHLSMLALEKLSLVDTALEGKAKSLLCTCFSSVFWLPAEKEMPKADLALYIKGSVGILLLLLWHRGFRWLSWGWEEQQNDCHCSLCSLQTLNSMDSMLRTVVLSFPASRVSEELQGILELLLDFTRCEREAVRERAMARIDVLARVLSDYSTLQANANARRGTAGPVCSGEIQLPLLGKLLGRLILFRFSEEQTSCAAFHALFALAEFIFESRLKDRADQVHWEAVTTSALCSLSARDCAKTFGKYLQSHERTDVILVAIEALGDASILDQQVPSSLLDVALEDPDVWLTDAPKIVTSILESLPYCSTQAAWEKAESLLRLMTNLYPTTVVILLCKAALQGDSTAPELWELMSSMPETLSKILEGFANLLHRQCFRCSAEGPRTQPMASSSRKAEWEDLADEPDIESHQGCPNERTARLLLEGLVGLSQRAEMARNIELFLPGMMKILQAGSEDAQMKTLLALRNVLRQLKKSKASFIAVQLVGRLLPLFDSECSELRELSIRMLTELLQLVVGRDEKRMRKEVWRALVPLLFRMSDQVPSVAKVQC
ncbi:maestro heat-like repeat family member 5 [Pseudopipra pipra]|uniref:maestro heat-like repeat family member 5 n=1 Tax=Pseudopipra pipra TaxID=415032 RepID=UPI0031398342